MSKAKISNKDDENIQQQLLKDLEPTIGKIKKDKKRKTKTIGEFENAQGYFSLASKEKLEYIMNSDTKILNSKKRPLAGDEITSVLEAPSSKPEDERKIKKINYQALRKDLNEWQDIIVNTKKAPILKFPLHDNDVSQPSLLDWIEDVADIPSKTTATQSTKAISAKDDRSIVEIVQTLDSKDKSLIEKLHLEEMLLKRRQLSNYYEFISKFGKERNRIKKIKSKGYHRKLKKKEKKELQKLDVDEMKTDNPEKYEKELENAEKMRAEERACLRHRGGSKWSKNKLLKGQKNPQIRNAILEQLRINKDLITSNKVISEESATEEQLEDTKAAEILNSPIINEKMSTLLTNQWYSNDQKTDIPSTTNTESKYPQPKPFSSNSKILTPSKVIDANPKETIQNILGENSINTKNIESIEAEPTIPFELNEIDQTQLDDIAEAFKDDDAIEEFIEEKEHVDPTELDDAENLPGWGTWATSFNINKKKPLRRNRILISDDKPHVIFNPPQNLEIHKHLVTQLPHKYKNKEEYEKEVTKSLGPDWNTPMKYYKNITPRIQLNSGVPIPPMSSNMKTNPSTQRLRQLASSLPLKIREKLLSKI